MGMLGRAPKKEARIITSSSAVPRTETGIGAHRGPDSINRVTSLFGASMTRPSKMGGVASFSWTVVCFLACHCRPVAAAEEEISIIGSIVGDCNCVGAFDCSSGIDGSIGIVIYVFLMLYMFKGLGTMCDEYFVPALEEISEALSLSPDVAGATFMAAGSSAPELFTSLVATFLIPSSAGVGTIIGSAIFNILVIVGATCFFAGQVLRIWWYPLSRDCFFYMVAIAEMGLFMLDEEIQIYESIIMVLSYLIYCVYMKYNEAISRKLGLEPPDSEVTKADPEEKYAPGPEGEQATKGADDQNDLRAAARANP